MSMAEGSVAGGGSVQETETSSTTEMDSASLSVTTAPELADLLNVEVVRARHLTKSDKENVRDLFDFYDTRRKGRLPRTQVVLLCKQLGLRVQHADLHGHMDLPAVIHLVDTLMRPVSSSVLSVAPLVYSTLSSPASGVFDEERFQLFFRSLGSNASKESLHNVMYRMQKRIDDEDLTVTESEFFAWATRQSRKR